MFQAEVDKTLCFVVMVLHQIGFWHTDEQSYRREMLRRTVFIFNTLFLIFIIMWSFQSDDNEKLFLMEVAVSVAVALVKLFYMLWRKDEILTFFEDPIVTHCITNRNELAEVNDKIKKIGKFFQFYFLMMFVSMSLVIIAPLPMFSGQKMLPLFIRFDSESDYETVIYWLLFVFMSLGVILSMITSYLMLFVWYIMHNYSIEYKLLGNRFKRLGGSTYQQEFADLIDSHKNLSG